MNECKNTEPSEPERVDTSTPEGWEKVVKHVMDGGQYEFIINKHRDGIWNIGKRHPIIWDKYYLYRIKPQRVPVVLDKWLDEDSGEVHLITRIEGESCWLISTGLNTDNCVGVWNIDSVVRDWEYVGKFDMSLLKGVE